MRPKFNRNPRGGGKRNFGAPESRRNDQQQRPMNSLKECDVGISEFIGDAPPFNGVIKAKFSDFQVHEIDLDGNIAILNDIEVPKTPEDSAIPESVVPGAEPDLAGLITAEDWKTLNDIVISKDKTRSIQIDVTDTSKENRTTIHGIIKGHFGKSVMSSTVEANGKKFIKASLFNKTDKSDVRIKWLWPHEYTYFIVHKFNMDTMKACSELALNLKVKPSVLAYAGTKDKRANTSQWFCIKKRDPDTIKRAAQKIYNLQVGNFTFKPQTLKLGQLKGNHFKIALRQISVDPEVVEKSLESIKDLGFINYYGLQRFGNSASVPTFAIGKALLMGKWLDAVELIMKPREGDLEYMRKMREHWWTTRDAVEAKKMLHKSNNSIEAKLLHGLAMHSQNDLVNALECIPRNVRLLYIHCYQSLLWNKAASKRAQLGLKPIVGDLVYANDSDKKTLEGESTLDIEDLIEEDNDREEPEAPEPVEEKPIDYKKLVKPLTQAEVDSGSYTIFDIVLPLPGYDITYPENHVGAYYTELLAADGLTSESLKQKVKTYSLTGAYRKLVEKPEQMTWRFVKYSSDADMLFNTDYELIKQDRLIAHSDQGPLTACLLEFSLKSSTYATMALREILKIDTSAQHHINLTKSNTTAAPVIPEKKQKLEDPAE